MSKINRCSFSSAQRSYDNRMPEDSEAFPDEMQCPECYTDVELSDTGVFKIEPTGTCSNCGAECKFDFNGDY